MVTKRSTAAADAVISRLLQMRQLWDDASKSYFDPGRFQISLQNCVTVSRTVTFILQANKGELKNFDEWYAPYQERWRADPIMVWAREARNTIEKRGDLETNSQVRAKIIASYLDEGPETGWVPQALFASVREIYESVPKRYRIPHILENGTLLIERRWVDSSLPDIEVLEALAHVYGELADMVVAFLERAKIATASAIASSKLGPMSVLAMDRAVYLSMKDGSVRGFRYFEKTLEGPVENWGRKVIARYGKVSFERLKSARTFRAVAEAYFELGRVMMLRDSYHKGFTFFLRGLEVVRIYPTDFPDRASKYVLMRDLAQLAQIDETDGVFTIAEAWIASHKDIPKSGFAVDAKNRGEALVLHAVNSACESFSLQAMIERKRIKRHKVKRLGPTQAHEGGTEFMLHPFMKNWGCVDRDKLMRSFEQMTAMGIEHPRIER